MNAGQATGAAGAAKNADAVISVDAVWKSFGGQAVLRGVTLAVKRGETVAILGRSGTGKSVLLKTIVALLDPDRGSIRVEGSDLIALDEHGRLEARKRIGYVFQGSALFDSLSVADNVGFPLLQARVSPAQVRERVLAKLDLVGLSAAADKYPAELSGGMQKRVGLARALISDPAVVLYDEPTTGLDPLTTDVINRIVLRLQRRLNATALVVTHDVASAFTIADRVAILENGVFVAQGTPDEIRAHADPWVQRFIAIGSERGHLSGSHTGLFPQPIVKPDTPKAESARLTALKADSDAGSEPG